MKFSQQGPDLKPAGCRNCLGAPFGDSSKHNFKMSSTGGSGEEYTWAEFQLRLHLLNKKFG